MDTDQTPTPPAEKFSWQTAIRNGWLHMDGGERVCLARVWSYKPASTYVVLRIGSQGFAYWNGDAAASLPLEIQAQLMAKMLDRLFATEATHPTDSTNAHG